jgi:TldD protein
MPLAKNLAAMASGQAARIWPHLANPWPGLVNPVKLSPDSLDTQRKVEMVRAAEAAARAVDSRIAQVRMMYRDLLPGGAGGQQPGSGCIR